MSGLMMVESIKANGSEGDLFAKWAGYAAKASVATQEMKLWAMKVKLLPLLAVLMQAVPAEYAGDLLTVY